MNRRIHSGSQWSIYAWSTKVRLLLPLTEEGKVIKFSVIPRGIILILPHVTFLVTKFSAMPRAYPPYIAPRNIFSY